jgi:23S rRNA pseudouridine1911/1915/1917 synthase
VVHPSAGHADGTLANALTARFPQTSGVGTELRPGIVHRLDKDTSGLMVIALTPSAYASLQQQIAERSARRQYLALVEGGVLPERGRIDAPIGRDAQNRLRMGIDGIAARDAQTTYRLLEKAGNFSLLEATLHTGRTHQVRVHLAAIGHPIVGDRLYGGSAALGLERQFLHAYRLGLRSPSSGTELAFTSRLPYDLSRTLTAIGMEEPEN